ncbi:MAG: TRAP transporter small permease [Phreatobacter sp.]
MKHVFMTLDRIEDALDWLAAAAMLAIMVVVAWDVAMRYGFNRPLSWAYDLISLYLLAGVFFLALSRAYSAGAHVNVDILQQKLPPSVMRVTEIITCALGAVIFAVICHVGFDRALEAFQAKDVMSGGIEWPTWPALALVPVGFGLLAVRLAAQGLAQLLSLITGHAIVPPGAPRHSAEEGSFE